MDISQEIHTSQEAQPSSAKPPYRLPMCHRQYPAVRCRCVNFLWSVLLTLVLVGGIILFVLWLSLRPHRPKFFLSVFSIPNVNRQSGPANLPVKFTVDEHNPNQIVGIYYEAIYGMVYYGDQLVASGPVAYPFYQAPKGDTPVQGELTAAGPTPSDPAWQRFACEVASGSVGLRLRLNSTVKFQVRLWDTRAHRHHMKVDCEFRLRGDGMLQEEDRNKKCALHF